MAVVQIIKASGLISLLVSLSLELLKKYLPSSLSIPTVLDFYDPATIGIVLLMLLDHLIYLTLTCSNFTKCARMYCVKPRTGQ